HFVQSRILLAGMMIKSGEKNTAISHLEKANEQLAELMDNEKEFPIIFGMIITALRKDPELQVGQDIPPDKIKWALLYEPETPALHISASAIALKNGDFKKSREEIKIAIDLLKDNLKKN
ncbi:MAG: hypothetical protein J7M18_08335, partial [Candidatus Eremiobacteraeota bacterium]|nr:hypothetical protein [Candidatus Eremiobacteraeota bacterium]